MTATAYSLRSYGNMITCEPRMSSYADALRKTIQPGAYVIDIGAGPGFFSLLACQLGAGRVTAIDPDASIEIGRCAAIDNGFADEISFVRGLSTDFEPNEQADVIVSDIRGVLPLFEHHIPTILDARRRLLKPGGVLIPAVDRIYAALVEVPGVYEDYRRPWLQNDFGIAFAAGHRHVVNKWRRTYQQSEALMSEAHLFATLDYNTIEQTNHRASLRFEATRPGTAHGILLWFDSELAPGISFSNAPGEAEQIYGQAFFPLEHPVTLSETAAAEAEISANLINGQYVWSWSFRATDTDGEQHDYRQSTFKGTVLTQDTLNSRGRNFRPPARTAQDADIACLGMFNGELALGEIARELFRRFPGNFRDEEDAFEHVASLSARYNR